MIKKYNFSQRHFVGVKYNIWRQSEKHFATVFYPIRVQHDSPVEVLDQWTHWHPSADPMCCEWGQNSQMPVSAVPSHCHHLALWLQQLLHGTELWSAHDIPGIGKQSKTVTICQPCQFRWDCLNYVCQSWILTWLLPGHENSDFEDQLSQGNKHSNTFVLICHNICHMMKNVLHVMIRSFFPQLRKKQWSISGTILTYTYLSVCECWKWHFKAIRFQNFLQGHIPRPCLRLMSGPSQKFPLPLKSLQIQLVGSLDTP